MKRPITRLDYELAYCAWLLLAPEWVARLPQPALSPWFACFADVARAAPASLPDDSDGQALRRAIIAGATAAEPFPGEIRGKAILVEAAVRALPVQRVAQLGTPGAIVRALGCVTERRPASRSA